MAPSDQRDPKLEAPNPSIYAKEMVFAPLTCFIIPKMANVAWHKNV